MRLHRFYVKQPLGEELVVVSKDLIHQWTSVFRFKTGDQVLLFSSSPNDFLYEFLYLSKNEARLSLISKKENISSENIVLYMSLVKKDVFETVVRQATELGVREIRPMLAARSEKKGLNLARLEVIAKEASEQSGRGDVPSVLPIMDLKEAISSLPDALHIVGSLHGEPLYNILPKKRGDIAIWVGPEGGFTEKEEELFRKNGFCLAKTGKTVLRADTAAVSLLSLSREA